VIKNALRKKKAAHRSCLLSLNGIPKKIHLRQWALNLIDEQRKQKEMHKNEVRPIQAYNNGLFPCMIFNELNKSTTILHSCQINLQSDIHCCHQNGLSRFFPDM